MRRLAVAVIVAGAACRDPAPAGEPVLETKLRRSIEAVLGMAVDRVRCTGARCEATVGPTTIPIRIWPAPRAMRWELDGLIVRAAALEAELRDALAGIELEAAVDCGPRVQVVSPGATVTCALRRPGHADAIAWARIDADGTAALEVIVDGAVAAARRAEIATAELDALSRALDRDELGEPEAEGVAPADAAPRDAGR